MGDEAKTSLDDLLSEVLQRTEEHRAATVANPKHAPAPDDPPLDSLEAIAELPDEDLRSVMAQVNPDRMLVALVTAPEKFKKRVLQHLGAEAREWMQANLPYLDRITDAAEHEARQAILGAAAELQARGRLGD